jgi:hypothetical protein
LKALKTRVVRIGTAFAGTILAFFAGLGIDFWVRTVAMRDPEIPRVEDAKDAGEDPQVEPGQERFTAVMGGIQLPPPTILIR